jgi:hypothetical protein
VPVLILVDLTAGVAFLQRSQRCLALLIRDNSARSLKIITVSTATGISRAKIISPTTRTSIPLT